jgi:Flp pilus assembly protein TadG
MLEFALVIPIFVFVLYGLIAFGIMLSAKQSIVHAGAEGARAAVGAVPNTGEQLSDAQTRVAKQAVHNSLTSALGGNRYDDTMTVASVANCVGTTGKCITVVVTYPYSSKPLVPPAPGLGLVSPSTLSTTAIVQVPG